MLEKKIKNLGFRMMVLTYRISDLFKQPGEILEEFDIAEGDTVVDYGCGPGRYLKTASELVGEEGKVYAADIHELALEYIKEEIRQNNLQNVQTVRKSAGLRNESRDQVDVRMGGHGFDE